jgi:hypothetical protein
MSAQVLFRLKQYAAASPELLPGTIIRDIHFDIKEAIAEIERLGIQVETMRNGLKPFAEALTRAERDEPSDPNARCGNCRERVTLYEFGQARKALSSDDSRG